MNETTKKYGEKRMIHLSKEQEERIAAQSVQKIQAFIGEAAQIQSRRCEVMVALLSAAVTRDGVDKVNVEKCRALAHEAVDADSRQKWTDLKALFAELAINGPQPHLEWAARQVGVVLFDNPPEEPNLIQPATTTDLSKVIQ